MHIVLHTRVLCQNSVSSQPLTIRGAAVAADACMHCFTVSSSSSPQQRPTASSVTCGPERVPALLPGLALFCGWRLELRLCCAWSGKLSPPRTLPKPPKIFTIHQLQIVLSVVNTRSLSNSGRTVWISSRGACTSVIAWLPRAPSPPGRTGRQTSWVACSIHRLVGAPIDSWGGGFKTYCYFIGL